MTLHQPPANVFYVCVSCFAREGPSQRHSAAEPQTMKKKSHSPNSHEITRKNCVLISVAATDAATQYGTGERAETGSATQLFGMLRWQAQARSPTGQLNPRQLAGREGGKAERAPAQAAKPLDSVIHNTVVTQVSPFLFQ